MNKETEFSIEEPLRSSVNDFKEFTDTSVWHDMRMTIQDRIELLSMQLENSEDFNEMLRVQGGIAEMRMMLNLPEYLMAVRAESEGNEPDEL